MPLQLEIISEHRDLVGDDYVHEFGEHGGTIGRSLDNDWILPDPDRYISGRHATIDYKGGMYYLADTSSNGVYVNDERQAVGKGNPRRLFNGDHLRMGDFEVVVSIDRGESIAMPLEGSQTELPEPIGMRVAEHTARSGVQLLDEEELAGAPDFISALLETETPTPVGALTAPEPAPSPEPDFDIFDEPDAPARPAPPVSPGAAEGVRITADDLFDTFLDGAGLSRADLNPDVDPAEALQNAGQVLRELVNGLARMLNSRRNLKAAFRLDQTTILPRHNNPLKLSENDVDSLRQLLVGKEGEYLGPRDAAREACRDLVYHQDALLDAMHSAFREFADRFEPDELLGAFRRDQGPKPFLGFLERLRYWQMYCDLYPVLTEKGDSRFPQLYAEEFVRAYERQIAEYKRVEAVPNLKATVKLDPRRAAARARPAKSPPPAAPAAPPEPDLPFADEAALATEPDTEFAAVFAAAEHAVNDDVPSIEFDDSFAELFDDERNA